MNEEESPNLTDYFKFVREIKTLSDGRFKMFVTHLDQPDGVIESFVTDPNDPHGKTAECHALCLDGFFGPIQTYVPPTVDELRPKKLDEINDKFSQQSAALIAGYPRDEQLTWPIQQAEALSWLQDSNSPTPYLDGLAQARGISVEEMRAKTLSAVQMWRSASQQLIGKRQALRDQVMSAQTVEQLSQIKWQE